MNKDDTENGPFVPAKGTRSDANGKKRLIKRKAGAPFLTPAGRQLVIDLGAEGASKALVAARLGLPSTEAFESILADDQKAMRAYEQGLAEHEHKIIEALTRQAVGDEDNPGSTPAARELLEKIHDRQPEDKSNIVIVLPDALSVEEYIRATQQRLEPPA